MATPRGMNSPSGIKVHVNTEEDNNKEFLDRLNAINHVTFLLLKCRVIDPDPVFEYLRDVPDSRAMYTQIEKEKRRAIMHMTRPDFTVQVFQLLLMICGVMIAGSVAMSFIPKSDCISSAQVTEIAKTYAQAGASSIKAAVTNATIIPI